MQKIKTWRGFALALLTLLLTAVLSFALVQIIPSKAETTFTPAQGDEKVQLSNKADGTSHWTEVEGTYTFAYDPDGYTSESGITPTIIYSVDVPEDENEYFITFEYSFAVKGSAPTTKVYIDETEQKYVSIQSSGDNSTSHKVALPLTSGAHTLKITIKPRGSKTTASCLIKNFQLRDADSFETPSQLSLHYYTGEYRKDGQDISLNMTYQDLSASESEAISITSDSPVPFPLGKKIMVSTLGPTKGALKDSAVDPSKKVSTKNTGYFAGFFGGSSIELSTSTKLYLVMQEDELLYSSNDSTWLSVPLPEGEDPISISYDMIENLPTPTVSAVTTINGDVQTISAEDLKDKTIEVPLGAESSIVLHIKKDFDGSEVSLTKENFSITVGGKSVNPNEVGEYEGEFGVVIPDNLTGNVEILYKDLGDRFYTEERYEEEEIAARTFYFAVRKTVENGLDSIVKSEGVTVTDPDAETTTPWIVDGTRATAEDPAFMAGSSFINGQPLMPQSTGGGGSALKGGISKLKIEVEGAAPQGYLTFEFQFDGIASGLKGTALWTISANLFYKYTNDFNVDTANYYADLYGTAEWIQKGKLPFPFESIKLEGKSTEEVKTEIRNRVMRMGDYALSKASAGLLDPDTMGPEKDDKGNGYYDNTHDESIPLALPTADTNGQPLDLDECVTKLANGWYRAKIKITPEQKVVYLAFISRDSLSGIGTNDLFVTVRNINFVTGSAVATVKLGEQSTGSFNASFGETKYENKEESVTFNDLTIGDEITLEAKIPQDGKFYGWVVNGEYYSAEEKVTVAVEKANMTIEAYMQEKNYFQARIAGKFYQYLLGEGGALEAAGSGDAVIITNSFEIAQNFEIPQGVSLILPMDAMGRHYAAGAYKGSSALTDIPWETSDDNEYKYLTLTIGQDTIVTVNGNFYVGAQLYSPDQYAQGHVSGAYSHLINNGTINVENGGVMDVYGRVTGTGKIDVKSGAKLYEPFLILDFSGGNNTLDQFSANMTPFNRYAMINIECKMIINHGGKLIGHAGLWALDMLVTLDQPFISDETGAGSGHDTIVMLKEGAKVTIDYDKSKVVTTKEGNNTELIGKTTMTFEGGAAFSYMQFTAMGISVPTSGVYFSLPYNFELNLNGSDAEYDVNTDFKLMPGSVVRVGAGATLNLNANVNVYDGLVQAEISGKQYPTAVQLTNAGYKTYASLIVNGTLNIKQKKELAEGLFEFSGKLVPLTFLGVVQTEDTTGTAKIIIHSTAILNGKVTDGALTTNGGCNYFTYDTAARVYDKAHGVLANLTAGKTYTAASDVQWTREEISVKWDNATQHGKEGKNRHNLEDASIASVSDMVGSWKVEHEAHSFDWSQLSGEEKDLEGAKYKDLHRQCTELGCADEEHKLLLSAEGFTLKDTYKGSAFTVEDLEKLFYKYYFGSETVPAELADCDFSASVNTGSEAIQNADDYENLTVTLMNGFFGDVNKTSETFTFTVEKFNLKDLDTSKIESALGEQDFHYDGTAKTLNLAEALKAAFGSEVSFSVNWANNTNATSDESKATVTITGTGDNFEGSTVAIEFSIAKAKLTVEVVGKTKPYDGKAWEGVNKAVETTDFTVTDGTIYNSDDLGLKLTVENAGADVGSYTVKGEASNTNYTVTVTSGAYTITRAELTLTVTAGQKHIYGQSPTDLTFTITGFQGSDTENALKELFELRSEGHAQWADYQEDGYDITVSLKNGGTVTDGYEAKDDSALKNYKVKLVGAKYTVEKKDIEGATFTVTTAYTYDNTAKEPTMSEIEVAWTGYSESDHTGLGAQFAAFTVGSYLNNTDAGDATVVVTATGNFTGTKTVNFKIEKATVDSITVNGEYAYTGAVQSDAVKGNIVVKSGELILNTGDYTVTFDRNGEKDVKDAGAYTVTVTLTEACKNYQLGNVTTATFEVAKAEVTVKANDQTTPQNEQILKEFTYTVSGGTFFNDDEAEIKLHFQYTTEAVSDTVKDFDIIIDWQKGYTCDNYDVTFEKGTYHIIDAIFKNVTVTGDGQITYNGQSHTLTVEVNNEALAGKTTVTITKDGETFEGATNAGTYSIHVNIKATGYQTEYNADFTLTITPIKVTVTFDAKSSTYGDAVKTETELTYTMPEDVLPKDQDTFKAAIRPTTNAESKSAVSGKYKITAEKPELQNYDVTIVDGVYTITARPVEVTVNKQSVTYNQKQQSAQSRNGTDWSVTDLASGEEATVLNVKLEATGTDAKAYDITASWKNSNYAVTFKGAEGLTVEDNIVKEAFVIEAAALTEATVTGSYTYNGQTQTPTFTVKAGGLTVEEGGFELEFAADADRVSAGTVQVTVKAKSANYSGEVKTQFTIAAKKIEVTLKAQSFEYSGKVPTPDSKAYTVEEGGLCSRNGKEDDLGITITLVDGNKNVGSYSLEAEASNTDYEVTFDKTQKLNITKKHITVKADDLTSTYGDAIEELTYTAEGLVEGEDPETALHITLQPERTIKEAGTYTITGTGSATNYAFDGVEEGTYTVEKREVTVKINDQSALYDGTEPSVLQGQGEDAGWTIVSGDIVDGDNLHIVLTKTEGVDADKYAISGAFANDNYEVTFEGTMETAGTYTVTPRAVTVEIYNQSATYDFTLAGTNGYSFNGAAWTVEQESLAPGEEKLVLGVTLTKPAMSDAGIYAITGSATNTNYVVTFTGEYAGEDENAGKAGVYTVMKKDLSEEALFVLFVGKGGDEGEMDGDRTVRAKFSGDPLSLAGSATITEGDERRALEVTSDPATIEKIGDHTVTLTIVDKNYQGKTEFLVIVTDANGYTEKLLKTLDDLEKLVAELDIDRLTVDDYAKLVEIYNALKALSDEERETGAEKLAEYQAYVDAWDSLANIDDVVETAQAVANAPIETLFEAAAMLTALAGLAYIALKGGLL